MARSRKTPGGEADVSPPAAPAAARSAFDLEEATKIGLFGVEIDATDDSAYSAVATATPGGAYRHPGVIPAPKET